MIKCLLLLLYQALWGMKENIAPVIKVLIVKLGNWKIHLQR